MWSQFSRRSGTRSSTLARTAPSSASSVWTTTTSTWTLWTCPTSWPSTTNSTAASGASTSGGSRSTTPSLSAPAIRRTSSTKRCARRRPSGAQRSAQASRSPLPPGRAAPPRARSQSSRCGNLPGEDCRGAHHPGLQRHVPVRSGASGRLSGDHPRALRERQVRQAEGLRPLREWVRCRIDWPPRATQAPHEREPSNWRGALHRQGPGGQEGRERHMQPFLRVARVRRGTR
mmetsp:Transcript_11230/g.38257  ORF Transcript_11230/g.38257 Transcript_11230/m.38257 type:complete len:231 (-) Transcript_11230:224-916(-)